MTAKTIAIGVTLVLVGCTSELISGNANSVSYKVGRHANNPGPQATQHCAKYGKSAALETMNRIDFGYLYVFKCE